MKRTKQNTEDEHKPCHNIFGGRPVEEEDDESGLMVDGLVRKLHLEEWK